MFIRSGISDEPSQRAKGHGGPGLCPLCAHKGIAAEGARWSYEGDGGPAKWGDLDAANKVCAIGSQQSPIDIGATIKSRLPALEINWARRAEPSSTTDTPFS